MEEDDTSFELAEDGGMVLRGGTYKQINIAYFRSQLAHLYRQWRRCAKSWRKSKVFIIETPEINNHLRSFKSSLLHVWLFGVEFPGTTIIFTKKKIHLLCKDTQLHLFGVLRTPISQVDNLVFHFDVKGTGDDGAVQLDSILYDAYRQHNNGTIKVGYPMQDDTGIVTLLNQLKAKGYFEVCDVTQGLSELLAIKKQSEIQIIEKSAFLNAKVMDPFVERVLKYIIDNFQSVSHSKLARKITELILNPGIIREDLSHERVNICYSPIVQSGRDFDFSPCATSNDSNLIIDETSVIICSIGSSYDDYCSYIVRTYLIEPTEKQKTAYTILLEAQKAIIDSLRIGATISMAYNAAREVVENSDVDLLPNLTESAGTGIGLEFNEKLLNINVTNDRAVDEGMVFNVLIGFQDLVDGDGNKFSVLLGDTVVVDNDGNSRVLTLSRKNLEDVTYPFEREGPQEFEDALQQWIQKF